MPEDLCERPPSPPLPSTSTPVVRSSQTQGEAWRQIQDAYNREDIRTLRRYATVPETPAGGLPGTQAEWDRLLGVTTSVNRITEELHRIITDNPSPEIQRRREEYARLAREMNIPDESLDIGSLTPQEQVIELQNMRVLAHGNAPGAPPEDRLTNFILNRITQDLGALGFPPEFITIDRSLEGDTSLTIHMPITQLTQLTGPGHSSVIFTQRR